MSGYPEDYKPSPLGWQAAGARRPNPHNQMKAWPNGLCEIFVACSHIISDCMQEIEAGSPLVIPKRVAIPNRHEIMVKILGFAAKAIDQMQSGHLHFTNVIPADPSIQECLAAEIAIEVGPGERNLIHPLLPFRKTVAMLLGPQAIGWLATMDENNRRTLNPNEASRERWFELRRLESQIGVESELRTLDGVAVATSKAVVGAAWVMASLMTFMDPQIFEAEDKPRVTSIRQRDISLSIGYGSHILSEFRPCSMIEVVKALRAAISSYLITSCDMMWIGASLASLTGYTTTTGANDVSPDGQFTAFFSHRGKDSKQLLLANVQRLPASSRLFLDCLRVSNGLVNRHFVFRSMANSQCVIIIETENFHNSEWCKKEAWFADVLYGLGLCDVHRVSSVPEAISYLDRFATEGESSVNAGLQIGMFEDNTDTAPHGVSWTCYRVLKDIDYWARAPNIYSAREKGLNVSRLIWFRDWIMGGGSLQKLDAKLSMARIRRFLHMMVLKVMAFGPPRAREGEVNFYVDSFDLLAAAVQLSVATMCARSGVYSKTNTRHHLDKAISVAYDICLNMDHYGCSNPKEGSFLLALACGIVSLDLSPADKFVYEVVDVLVVPPFIFESGTVLVDARDDIPGRDGLLKYVSALAYAGLASVGILQNGENPIHEACIDGRELQVLPCVTQYPGMEAMFQSRREVQDI